MATAAPRRTFLGRIGLRKSVAQIQEETRTSELKRSLGPWNLVFLGIGCIIGAGIFGVNLGDFGRAELGKAVNFIGEAADAGLASECDSGHQSGDDCKRDQRPEGRGAKEVFDTKSEVC